LTIASVDGDVIRIKAFVEISGPRATQAMAAVIEGEINGVWQDPANQQTLCGRKVEFEAEVRIAQGRGTEGWHQIYVPDLRPGQGFNNDVTGGHPNAYTSDLGGTWTPYGDGDRFGDYVYAHESGHLFGAPDEYYRDIDGVRRPNPGRERTLMAAADPFIDMGIVNNILQNAFPEHDQQLPRCIQGNTYEEVTIEEGPHTRTGFLSLTLTLETSNEGELSGTAKGEFTLAGTYEQDDCGFGYSTSAPIDLDIIATGEGDGPYRIESELPILIDEVQRHGLCGEPVDLVIDWEVRLVLDDVVFGEFTLRNGNVLGRQYHLDEETPEGKLQVHLWLNGVEGN
jgi:hypothetical protein